MRRFIPVVIYFLCLLGNGTIWGQEQQQRLRRLTPQDAIWVHLYYLENEHFEPGIAIQSFPEADSLTRINWALKLKQIFDAQGLMVQMNTLEPEQANDSLTRIKYYTPFPRVIPQIYLVRSDSQWYYSAESVDKVDDLFRKVYPMGTHNLVDLFADKVNGSFLGLSSWQWLGVGILLAGGLIIHLLFAWLLGIGIRIVFRSIEGIEHYKKHVSRIANALSYFLLVWIFKLFFPLLQFPAKANLVFQTITGLLLILIVSWLLFRAVKLLSSYLRILSSRTASKMDDQLVPVLEQILIIIVITGAVLHVLYLFDFNITALLAGVSLGGLALALAAQDTVKNFLGSLMIFADKPFQIGDWVEGSDFAGSIVEVGFRSTRIRTSDTSIISVPNGNMANVTVKNLGARQFRLFTTVIGLTYDTPPDLLETYIRGLREIVVIHPEVSNEDYYVYFNDLGSSSLNIFMRCYLLAPTYNDELRIRDSLLQGVVRWAHALGVRFAFPSSTLYIEEIPGKKSLTPTYHTDESWTSQVWQNFAEDFRERCQNQKKITPPASETA